MAQWFTEHEVAQTKRQRICNLDEASQVDRFGNQTSVISTIRGPACSADGVKNFFNYMMQHFDIDVLLDYGVRP